MSNKTELLAKLETSITCSIFDAVVGYYDNLKHAIEAGVTKDEFQHIAMLAAETVWLEAQE